MKFDWAQVKDKWLQAQARFEAFELRERALMVGAAIAVVYLAYEFIVFKPIADVAVIAAAQERVASQNITAAEAELSVLQALAERDPDVRLKQEIQQLQGKLSALDDELATLAVGLIKASELPVLLHQMLAQTQEMRLVSLTTLPVELIELQADKLESTANDDVPTTMAQLFKHGVLLKLEGNYSATYEFIKVLEESQWQFYWDSVDYQVKEYPFASVTLRIFTLASDKGALDSDAFDREMSAP